MHFEITVVDELFLALLTLEPFPHFDGNMFLEVPVDIVPFLEDLARAETAGEYTDLAVQVYSMQTW